MSAPETIRSGTLVDLLTRSVPFVIACGCLLIVVSFGPRTALGLFLQPMTLDRGWSREAFSLAVAIQNLMWGLGQPFAGALADRFGTARVLAGGAVLLSISLALSAHVETALGFQIAGGVLFGLGSAAASFSIVLAAFGRAVSERQRTIAFGIGTAAASLGQLLYAPLAVWLIDATGWQEALVVFALLVLAVPLLAVPLQGRSISAAGASQTLSAAISQAFGHGSYVLLVIGFFVCGFHVSFIMTHLPPYLDDMGLDAFWGGAALATIGLFNIVGSLAAGVIAGRCPKQNSLAVIYFARAAVIAAFVLLPVSPVTVILFAAGMGLLWLSTVPFTSGLVAVMFGPRYLATLFGFVFLSHQIGAFLGVWLGGLLYDETGSYSLVWWISVGLGVFAGLVHLPIRETPVNQVVPSA
ncbi:MFS transporter [Segnochrobactraceae bacterium EtOH-i3]